MLKVHDFKRKLLCSPSFHLRFYFLRYIDMCLKYIDMLVENNVQPILVFDGMELEAKAKKCGNLSKKVRTT